MKHVKSINEAFERDDFTFKTEDVDSDIINYDEREIDYMNSTCIVDWKLDFEWHRDQGIVIYPRINSIKFHITKDVIINDDGDTEEQEEFFDLEYQFEKGDPNVSVEWIQKLDYESVQFYPDSVELDWKTKNAIVYF